MQMHESAGGMFMLMGVKFDPIRNQLNQHVAISETSRIDFI